ncbi:MAG: DoxX family protein [Chitinophagaceae bacterium]|nr:MAG: DoxX family protein [Chitinophagaceae bacterium]
MKKFFLYLMAIAYIAAGINHFINPQLYLSIMPPWLPAHAVLVAVSGVLEILFGLMLFPRRSRRLAAWGLVMLLVAVLPANVQMLLNYIREENPHVWIAVLRLPLQPLLIWWAYVYTRPIGKEKRAA